MRYLSENKPIKTPLNSPSRPKSNVTWGSGEGKLAFSRDVGSALKTWRVDLVYERLALFSLRD